MNTILEHKSTSEEITPGSAYWKRLTLDPQVSIYLGAARAAGIDADSVLYDVLRKPQHRQAKGDKSPEDLELRCVEAIVAEPDKYFQRGTIVRLAEESAEAAHDLWQTAEQIRHAQKTGRWPRNPDACVQFGRPCDFWGVCSGEQDIHDPLIFATEDEPKRRLPVVRQSSTRAWRSCPQRYYFAYELLRRPRIVAEPLVMGRAIHKALEVWWGTRGDLEASLRELDGCEPWQRAKLRAMVQTYHARWESDLSQWEVVGVEQEFTVPLVNPESGVKSRTWEVSGRVDALVKRRAA